MFISELTFRHVVWLFPVTFGLHVLEEWPGFTPWARKHASSSFTQRHYDTIHATGIAVAIVSAALVYEFPNRPITFLVFSFVLAPSIFFNTIFHAGATVITREYCPGSITALTLYLPLFFVVSSLAWSEGLLNAGTISASFVIAGAFHTWEVGHNVFKAW